MIEIPRIKRRVDLVDALCCIHEDAGAFDLLDQEGLNHLSKAIECARRHTHKRG